MTPGLSEELHTFRTAPNENIMNKQDLLDALAAVGTFMAGLVPGALGAAIATAYEKGLTWSQRFLQMAVGIIVSYFAGQAFAAAITPSAFVTQAVSFTVGMIAYKSVPGFIEAAGATFRAIPGDVWAAIKAKFGA